MFFTITLGTPSLTAKRPGHQVFLVPVAQGHEGVHLLKALLLQQLLIGAVAIDHIDIGQGFAEVIGLFFIDFNHRHVNAHGNDHLGQIVADAAAAQQHHVFHTQGVFAQVAEVGGNGYHIGGHHAPGHRRG